MLIGKLDGPVLSPLPTGGLDPEAEKRERGCRVPAALATTYRPSNIRESNAGILCRVFVCSILLLDLSNAIGRYQRKCYVCCTP